MHPPQIPILEGRGVLEEAILSFADGLFSDGFIVPTVSFTISGWRVESKDSGFSFKYNGVYLLLDSESLLGWLGCVRRFIYPVGKATGLKQK